MKRLVGTTVFLVVSFGSMCSCGGDWSGVEKILQRTGEKHGEVLTLRYPRTDLKVKVAGIELDPAMGMTSTFRFHKKKRATKLLGEIILLPQEVAPVLRKLDAEGLTITALNAVNSAGYAKTAFSVHFTGEGDSESLVWAMTPALSATYTPTGPPEPQKATITRDWSKIEAVLGVGRRIGAAYVIPIRHREIGEGNDAFRYDGESEVSFQVVPGGLAATGSFPLLAAEIKPVNQVLLDHGITVTGFHTHDLGYSGPVIYYLNFWGIGENRKIIAGIKAVKELLSIPLSKAR